MATPLQKAQIRRSKNRQRREENPIVFYLRRTDTDGIHEFQRSDGSVIQAYLSGNAAPLAEEPLIYIPSDDGGLGLVQGRSVFVQERRIASLPREEYAAAVLFTKRDSASFEGDTLTVIFNGNTQRSLSGWNLTGFDETDVIITTSIFDAVPGQVYSFSGTGLQRGSVNVSIIATFRIPNTPEGSIASASGVITIDAGRDTTAAEPNTIFSDNIIARASLTAVGSDSIELISRDSPSKSSWSLNFGLSTGLGLTNRLRLNGGAGFVDENGNADDSIESAVAFSASFSFTFVNISETVEFWIGGDRTALLLWELTSMVNYMEDVDLNFNANVRSSRVNERATTLPYTNSGTIVDPGGGTVGLTRATLDYSISVSTSSFQMSGAGSAETRVNPNGSIDNPAGAVGWAVRATVTIGTLDRGIYRISGFFGGNLSGDFRKSFRLDVDPLGTETTSSHGTPRATFSASWGPEPGSAQWSLGSSSVLDRVAIYTDDYVGAFSRVIDVPSTFPLRISAEVLRLATGDNNQFVFDNFPDAGPFGGGLSWNVTYGLNIDQIPEAYLAASKNFLYAFIRNSEVARYIKIATAGIEESTDYSAGQTINVDENDWRNSRATFQDPPPDDPDPCRQQNRFNDFVNLQRNNRISINQAQQIEGTSLQERLIAGESIQNATIDVAAISVDGTRCDTGSTQPRTVKTIDAIVDPGESATEDIQIASITPYRKR